MPAAPYGGRDLVRVTKRVQSRHGAFQIVVHVAQRLADVLVQPALQLRASKTDGSISAV